MLYKNHQKVSLLEEELYKKHEAEFKSILGNKKYVSIKTTDKLRINATGAKERDRFQTVPVETTVANAEGTDVDTWIYVATAPKTEQNGQKKYDKAAIKIEREIQIPVTEKDKLFYLLFLSAAGRNGRIYVINELKEAEDKVTHLKETSRISFLIMDELSPVDEVTIKRVAKAFGVGNVDGKNIIHVKLELKNIIDSADATGDKFRDSKAFVQAINLDQSTQTRAVVQEAIDADRIKYNEVGAYFYYCNPEGEEIKKIMNVDMLSAHDKIKRINSLFSYFNADEERRLQLSRLMNYTVEDVDFSIYEYTSLKRFASIHGISGKGTGEELVARVTEFFEKNKGNMNFDMSILAVSKQKAPAE
jgi:hypothetical protein